MLKSSEKNIIILWAHPRSCSTAFFRMMVARGDFICFHEPLCTLYDKKIVSIELNGKKFNFTSIYPLLKFIENTAKEKPVFIKETTDHFYENVLTNTDFINRTQHAFLIRNLSSSILSHFKINPDVKCDEIGYQFLYKTYQIIKKNKLKKPIILNANALVETPQKTIKEFCRHFDLKFYPQALSWPPSDLPQWQSTHAWHRKVATSTGFHKIKRYNPDDLNKWPRLVEFYNFHKPFYDKFLQISNIRLNPDNITKES